MDAKLQPFNDAYSEKMKEGIPVDTFFHTEITLD